VTAYLAPVTCLPPPSASEDSRRGGRGGLPSACKHQAEMYFRPQANPVTGQFGRFFGWPTCLRTMQGDIGVGMKLRHIHTHIHTHAHTECTDTHTCTTQKIFTHTRLSGSRSTKSSARSSIPFAYIDCITYPISMQMGARTMKLHAKVLQTRTQQITWSTT